MKKSLVLTVAVLGSFLGADVMAREMSTDRPDKTESPYTVDRGRYQVEMSFIDYTRDRNNTEGAQEDVDSISAAPVNLKAGLNNRMDLQVVMVPYTYERTETDTETTRKRGFGDVQTRLKVNMWGNDGGKTAFAMMPFVKFPTNTGHLGNDDLEGGIILPLAVELPGGWGMGLMTEFDFNHHPDESGMLTDYINSITFSHQIVGPLDGYVEFFSNITDGNSSEWVGTVDAGVTYALTEDIQLDAGVNVGVTRSADDINPFCGLSVRY